MKDLKSKPRYNQIRSGSQRLADDAGKLPLSKEKPALPETGQKSTLGRRDKRTQEQAANQFREWSSIFPGKLFVMLAAYADESFAEDKPGRIPTSAFGGFVASVTEWEKFNSLWRQVLDDHDAATFGFHFSKWSMAMAVAKGKRPTSDFHKNPYRGWEKDKLNSFLFKLAAVAHTRIDGSFGGYLSLKRFNQRKSAGEILIGEDYRDYCLKSCFEALVDTLNYKWRKGSERVSVVWDDTETVSWKKSIVEAYEPFKKNNPSFASITFANDQLCLPLQAADMVAYRIRQKTDKRYKGERDEMTQLDKILFGDGKTGSIVFHNTA